MCTHEGRWSPLRFQRRLLIASVDKAKEMGINWWEHDPALTQDARTKDEDALVHKRLERLERKLDAAVRQIAG